MSLFTLKKPNEAALQRFVAAQRLQPLSHAHLGMTAHPTPPPGFAERTTAVLLGRGEAVFSRAVVGLKVWVVYPPWMTLYPPHAPVQVGTCVAILTGLAGVWTLSAVRITEVEQTARRFSFTLGTLPQHAVSGEERFAVAWGEDERVWYEISAFSRAQHPLVKLGSPVFKFVQRRFARDSVRSLRSFISARLSE